LRHFNQVGCDARGTQPKKPKNCICPGGPQMKPKDTHRDGGVDQVEALLVGGDVGCEAALVTHVAGILAVLLLDDALEVVVHLAGHLHGLCEGGRAHREDHELLHAQPKNNVQATALQLKEVHFCLPFKKKTPTTQNNVQPTVLPLKEVFPFWPVKKIPHILLAMGSRLQGNGPLGVKRSYESIQLLNITNYSMLTG
jgi:hypothetical protein